MRLEEVYPSAHTFHYKTLIRPRSCDFCKQMLQNKGACCADCSYTCHEECRAKVISSCECPSRSSLKFSSLPHDYHFYSYKAEPQGFIMDVVYLTRRIVFLSYPETGSNLTHASNLNEVAQMLNAKHGNSYMVFNLSERKHDLTQFKAQVLEFGWPPCLAPPLQRLCSICKAIDTWLISDPKSVVVLHSKGDKGRIGTVISAYLHYTSICSPNEQLLEKHVIKEQYMEKLSPFMHPSQKRYVHYFAGLLSGVIKMNNNSVFLCRIIINGIPNFEVTGGCKPFFKIYQGMQHVYTTRIFSVSGRARQIVINLDPSLQLHGDIMIKCYHSVQQPSGRCSVFRVQFHTCTLEKDWLSFGKEELDDASNDYRFPDDGRVEFHFTDGLYHSKRNDPVFDATPYFDGNESNLSSWDSYENFSVGPDANIQLSPSITKTPLNKRESQLDELLDDMIREIHSISEVPLSQPSYPRPKKGTDSGQTADYGHPQPIIAKYSPTAVISVNGNRQVLSPSPGWIKDTRVSDDEEDKPYHSRKNCAPFTYGVRPGSPVLRRKHLRPVSPPPSVDNHFKAENLLPKDVLEEQVFVTDDARNKEPNSQNWLMKQQEKLKARKEGRVWEDRQQREQLLMAELVSSHKRMSPDKQDDNIQQSSSPVPRAESPSKVVSYATPLHVTIYNGHASTPPPSYTMSKPPIGRGSSAPSSPLLPSRSSSRDATRNRYQQWQSSSHPLTRQKSDTLADRERPFASVKRAHQASRDQMGVNKTPPYQIISSSPVYGNINQVPQDSASDTDMLLSLLEQPKTNNFEPAQPAPVSPTSSKLEELEQSLQALSSSSPPRSPQTPHHGRLSPLPAAQSTPSKPSSLTNDNASSWSLPVVSSSPQGSPHTSDRPETPAFPVHPGTPYFNHESRTGSGRPPRSPVLSRKDGASSPTIHSLHQSLPNVSNTASGRDSPYFGQSQRSSMLSLGEPAEVIHHHPLFVKDTSKYWYKPNISREEAINMLKDKPPGTFIVRDSNSFPGAFGLALKVATPPPNIQNTTGDISNELVRHFLIEPTSKGVRLKGCANEPVFGTLSALVYQHSMTPLALPCKLILPESDPTDSKIPETVDEPNSVPLIQGAACNLLYLGTADVETLTGSAAVERGFSDILKRKPAPKSSLIHFKVSGQGITLTDNSHKLFFRRHYPLNAISHCGLDPRNRRWDEIDEENNINVHSSHCLGFIAKKPGTKTDNQCHMFAELEAEQPASAIINFVHKVMTSSGQSNKSNMI